MIGAPLHRVPFEIGDLPTRCGHLDDDVLAHLDGFTREVDGQGGHIGGDEHLGLAHAQDQRAIAPGCDEQIRIVGVHRHESERAFQASADHPHGLGQTGARTDLAGVELRGHLRVRLRGESDA